MHKPTAIWPIANHEMLCVGGDSHPMSPGLKHWLDGDVVRGSVSFNWSYEGPPQHAHGGWVAAVFDHFMGVAHMRFGKPGMTGGLELRYLQPTPLNKTLDLAAIAASTEGRKNPHASRNALRGRLACDSDGDIRSAQTDDIHGPCCVVGKASAATVYLCPSNKRTINLQLAHILNLEGIAR